MMRLRAEQEGLVPLAHLLFTRATIVSDNDEPVMRNTTRFDGSYLEDGFGRRGCIRFQPRQHWLARLLTA